MRRIHVSKFQLQGLIGEIGFLDFNGLKKQKNDQNTFEKQKA